MSDIELICSPVSDEPAASIITMCGNASRIRPRTLGVSGALPLLIAASPLRSYGVPAAAARSTSSTSGSATASLAGVLGKSKPG